MSGYNEPPGDPKGSEAPAVAVAIASPASRLSKCHMATWKPPPPAPAPQLTDKAGLLPNRGGDDE